MSDRGIHASQARVCAAVAGEFQLASPDVVLRIWRRCTELLARENRQEKRVERDRIIQNARAPETNMPSSEREQHGAVTVLNAREASGQRRMVALDPVQQYLGRGWITPRQARAAARYRDDYDLGVVGARDPDVVGSTGSRKMVGYTEAQLEAAHEYVMAHDRLGPSFVFVVEQVVLYERTVRDLVLARAEATGKKREPTRGESDAMFWLLRAGLDILGDAYGEPAELVAETVSVDPPIRIQYRFEKDGTVSGVVRNGKPWIASARNLEQLKKKAISGVSDADTGVAADL